nr:hypothetical protein [Desulforamulus aquiferis]
MESFQIENLYKVNGITDYKLKSTDDLLRTHGIDYKAVAGYKSLDDLNKLLYEKFIINIYNAFGLRARATLLPKGIYFVEDEEYLITKQDEEGQYNMAVGGVIKSIDKNGNKTILHTWEDQDYKHLKKKKRENKTYLRFEYEIQGGSGWLHVMDEESWY